MKFGFGHEGGFPAKAWPANRRAAPVGSWRQGVAGWAFPVCLACILLAPAGCTTGDPTVKPIAQAWRGSGQPEPVADDGPTPPAADHGAEAPATAPAPIATVNERPVSRRKLIELLVAGRGAEVLDELIVLELARARAEAAGLAVSPADIENEYDESLRSMLSDLPGADPDSFDRDAAEALLEEVLLSRGLSRQEFRLGVTRNAYLRKLAAAGLRFDDQELRAEFDRAYGERVRIRHIQVAGLDDAERIRRQLAAGADFASLAREQSANRATAANGGLLRPFTRDTSDVPALLREAAFQLPAGEVSNPIRVNNWYHLLRVEERIGPSQVEFEEVRGELQRKLAARRIRAEMMHLSAELFEAAEIRVLDPLLESEFLRRHPEKAPRGGASSR